MSQDESEDITRVYSALGHPLRKKIVEIISERQRVGFKDFKDMLNVSVGTLYFHLEMLGNLVEQDAEKKYVLTEKGKLALKLLGSGEEQLQASEVVFREEKRLNLSSIVKDVVFGRQLLVYATSNPRRFIPEALIILGLGAWIFAETKIEPVIMFYNNQPTWSSPLVIMLEFVVGWFSVFGLCELFSFIFYRRPGGEAGLLVGTIFSLTPLLILPAFLQVNNLLNLGLIIDWLWVNVSLLAFQAWTLCLLSATIGLAKGLKTERAALISMIVMYVNIGLLIIFFIL